MKNIVCISLFTMQILFATGQSIYFNFSNGTSSSYNLIDIEKITFDEDVMRLHLLDGSLFNWNVSSIGHYAYDENNVGNVDELLNEVNSLNLHVYPNPAGEFISLSYSLSKEDAVHFEIYDHTGRQLTEKNVGPKTLGDHQEEVFIGDLPSGNYLLKVKGREWTMTKKIIKE